LNEEDKKEDDHVEKEEDLVVSHGPEYPKD
jgi:hypothetical protein